MSKMPAKILTTIPFAGFYESYHDGLFDEALERVFQDDSGSDMPWSGKLHQIFSDSTDWRKCHVEYAKDYVAAFSEYIEVPMEFESLHSPKEYNFGTDRIFVLMKSEDFSAMWKKMNAEKFVKECKEQLTSRSGFMSYYSPDYTSWGAMSNWDFNQYGIAVKSYADQVADYKAGTTFQECENSLVEDFSGNGQIDNMLWGHCHQGNRLSAIHEYLMKREARKEECVPA